MKYIINLYGKSLMDTFIKKNCIYNEPQDFIDCYSDVETTANKNDMNKTVVDFELPSKFSKDSKTHNLILDKNCFDTVQIH